MHRLSMAGVTLIGALLCINVSAAPHVAPDSSTALDAQIATTLSLFAKGDLAQASTLARSMAWRFPDFALGQLIAAELESTAAFKDMLTLGIEPMSQPLIALLQEAQARLPNTQATSANAESVEPATLPHSVIQIGTHTKQLLLIDLERSTLHQVMGSDQAPTLVQQHYIGAGKAGFGKLIEGDNKTPLGVYSITGVRSDASLPDLYGSGALMLDYPNALDRHLGRTGSGIWLHGVPHAQRSRSPRSSEGCVTMSNDHLLRLKQQITPSDALVVLGHNFEWQSQSQRLSRQQAFQQLFSRYQQGWLNSNRTQLLSLYADAGLLEERIEANGDHQMQVNSDSGTQPDTTITSSQRASASYLQNLDTVEASDISILLSPSLTNSGTAQATPYLVMQARFGLMNKHQLTLHWIQGNDGKWLIVSEQWAGLDS